MQMFVYCVQEQCSSRRSALIDTPTIFKVAAVLLYCSILLLIGWRASKRMRSIRDYFAADKKLGFWNVAFSARATGESAWLLLGLTGTGFAFGIQGFWVVLGELLGVGGAWLLMAKRFKRLTNRYDSITVPDYLESRLRDNGHMLRLIAAGALIIFVPIYAASQVHATGKAFNAFLEWPHMVGAIVGFLVVLFYITKGGFVAVVWSDVFQGLLMVTGLVLLPIVGLLEVGGVTNLLETLRSTSPGHLTLDAGTGWTPLTIATVIGFAAIGIGFLGSPQVFVRFISLRSEKEIPKGAAVALVWTLLADGGAVLVGVVGRALYNEADLGGDAENILPVMSQQILHPFLAGVFIAMVLSAIMSTIDSLLVVASSAGVRDYWQKTRHPDMPDETLLKLSQRVTLALAVISFLIGLGLILYDKEQGVFWLIIFGWSGIAATFCPTMILSLFWSGLTSLGARCSMVTGFVCVPFFKFAAPPLMRSLGWNAGPDYLGELDVLLPAFIVSGAVGVVVSLFDTSGKQRMAGIKDELRSAASRDDDANG